MSTNTESQSSSMDTLKWGLVLIILAGTVVGNFIYGELSVLIRALAVVTAIVIAIVIALQTDKGRNALSFAKESRTEVRKVVWPTRQEAIQTTGIVIVVTLIMSVILWDLIVCCFGLLVL